MTLAPELVQHDRVHRSIYTDPAIFSDELTRVFARSWCFLAHDSQLPEIGSFLTTSIGGRSVVVTRTAEGITALLNRCAHRGAQLVTEPTGCTRRFTCPYHGWSFAGDGRLVSLPFPNDHRTRSRDELGLGRLEVATHRGFVFGTLHPDPGPLADWLGGAARFLDALIDRHPGAGLRLAPTPQLLEFDGNWKLSWDNAADGIHATFAHRSYNQLGQSTGVDTVLERDPGRSPMRAYAMTHGHMVVDQRPGIPDGPWSTMRDVPFVEGLAAQASAEGAELDLAAGSMVNVSLFPNLIFVGNQLMIVEPIAVDRTRLKLFLALGADGERDDGPLDMIRLRTDEDFVSFGTPDDLEMFERIQRGLAIPEMEWIDTSRGLGADEETLPDGTRVGPITSETPQRNYLERYRTLMAEGGETRAR